MIVFLNGRFIPEEQAVVSVSDRGFLYGDGLFETLRAANGRPFRWDRHLDRLQRGAAYLNIPIPQPPETLADAARDLLEQNNLQEAVLRITLSRGPGPRGYSPAGADRPTLVMTAHPAPDASALSKWTLITASLRLPAGDPLTAFKTANKLPQVLARAEADQAGADEALLLNQAGHVVETSSANLFWIEGGTVCTPPVSEGALPGITRESVMELAQSMGIHVRETVLRAEQLPRIHGMFLTLSTRGIVEVASVDGHAIPEAPLTRQLHAAYKSLVTAGTQVNA